MVFRFLKSKDNFMKKNLIHLLCLWLFLGGISFDPTAFAAGMMGGGGMMGDTTPDAFSFTDQVGVALNSTATSNEITISGITASTTIRSYN
jgi:hypothetical protein